MFVIQNLKIKVVSKNLASTDVGVARRRLNETIIYMFKESKEDNSLKDYTDKESLQKNKSNGSFRT